MLRGGGGEAQGFREFCDEVVIDCVFWFVGCLNCGHFYGWGVERIPGWRGECLGKNMWKLKQELPNVLPRTFPHLNASFSNNHYPCLGCDNKFVDCVACKYIRRAIANSNAPETTTILSFNFQVPNDTLTLVQQHWQRQRNSQHRRWWRK